MPLAKTVPLHRFWWRWLTWCLALGGGSILSPLSIIVPCSGFPWIWDCWVFLPMLESGPKTGAINTPLEPSGQECCFVCVTLSCPCLLSTKAKQKMVLRLAAFFLQALQVHRLLEPSSLLKSRFLASRETLTSKTSIKACSFTHSKDFPWTPIIS